MWICICCCDPWQFCALMCLAWCELVPSCCDAYPHHPWFHDPPMIHHTQRIPHGFQLSPCSHAHYLQETSSRRRQGKLLLKTPDHFATQMGHIAGEIWIFVNNNQNWTGVARPEVDSVDVFLHRQVLASTCFLVWIALKNLCDMTRVLLRICRCWVVRSLHFFIAQRQMNMNNGMTSWVEPGPSYVPGLWFENLKGAPSVNRLLQISSFWFEFFRVVIQCFPIGCLDIHIPLRTRLFYGRGCWAQGSRQKTPGRCSLKFRCPIFASQMWWKSAYPVLMFCTG